MSYGKTGEDAPFGPVSGQCLPLEDFLIPPEELAQVRRLLSAKTNEPIHILVLGPTGVGKSAFARSAAQDVAALPIEPRGSDALASVSAMMNAENPEETIMPIFEMADDLFDWGGGDKLRLAAMMDTRNKKTIWTARSAEGADAAILRRFAYCVKLRVPESEEEKKRIWIGILKRRHATRLMTASRLAEFTAMHGLTPGMIDRAVATAKAVAASSAEFAGTLRRWLDSYFRTMPGFERGITSGWIDEGATLRRGGSADDLLAKFRRIDAILRGGETIPPASANVLLYGPPGSGKSAFARRVAEAIGRPVAVRHASDINHRYVGESEKAVAEAFSVLNTGAVLVLDEIDSFIYSRASMAYGWEAAVINEFLTRLETSRGFVFCTTNRLESLDAAAFRRFAFKVELGYCAPRQAELLYESILAPLARAEGTMTDEVHKNLLSLLFLTPGDFVAVRSRLWLDDPASITHERLVSALSDEQRAKQSLTELK